LAMLKGVVDDGYAEINGHRYDFTKMVHKERRKVFAFYTKIQSEIQGGSFWFLESPEFAEVESIIESRVQFGGQSLSKLGNHWNLYPDDYVLLIQTALGVISYPFFPEKNIGSQSPAEPEALTTSKKPIVT